METEKIIEAILFVAGDPITIKDLVRISELPKHDVEKGIETLELSLKERGIHVLKTGDTITLVTAPEVSLIASRVAKERLEGDLSRPALETLAIIIWKGKVSRTGIDYVRGVNSSFSLRTLLMRGLIERHPDPKDARAYLYNPTIDLMKFLGVTSPTELPNFEEIKKQLSEYE
jgi:segregation and condensation protein B